MIKNINNTKNIIISHEADIDGMGSVILSKKVFNNIDYILCNLTDLENIFNEELLKYETIYICDLPLIDSAIKEIDKFPELKTKIKHFDHHKSMINDSMPPYANYVIKINDKFTCGTELFYNYLLQSNPNLNNNFYKTFVESTRSYDIWDQESLFNEGKELASLHAIIGPNNYINLILSLDDTKEFELPEIFKNIIENDKEKMDNYTKKALDECLIATINDYKVAISIRENYRSHIGHELCLKYPEVDYAMIINLARSSASLRCIKESIDVGDIALTFHPEGGGHKKASGFIIDKNNYDFIKELTQKYIENLK